MAGWLNEEVIFKKCYASLCDTLTDVDHLLRYFVQNDIINTNDIEEIKRVTTKPERVEKLLSHISGPLTAGDAKGFHIMLTIMKEHGNQSTKDLAVRMSHEMTLAINKLEDEVINTRSQESSGISYHQTSSPARATGSSEQSTVRTADPLSVQFSTFVATIETLLDHKCQDKLEQSKRFCSNLTISDNSDELLFSDEQLHNINTCTKFSELFMILRKHWSWKDYSILTHIISITDLEEAKDEAELFEKRMASYQGMKIISENISPDNISHDYIRLSIIIDKPYRELSLQNFTELHKFIFSNLDVKKYIALPFIKFLFRSLHLEWYVLKKAATHMIKMAKLNEVVFVSNSVVFIQVDQFVVLDCKSEVDNKLQIDDSLNNKSGGYDYQFVNTPPDRLVCKICHLPCCETQQSECCGSIYCKCDIDRLKATTTLQLACPICRDGDFVTYPNMATDREIQQLMVYCPDKEASGCDWVGKLKDVEEHYSYGRECETECENCKTTVKHKLLHSHLDTECPCYCPYCDITADREVISSEHKEKCYKFPLTCPNNCGLDNIPRDDMDEHQNKCPLEVIKCEFHDVGCEEKFPRKDKECHVKDNMTMHLHLTQLQLSIVNRKLEESNAKYLNSTKEVTKSLSELQERVRGLENLLDNEQPVNKDILLNLLQSKSYADTETQIDTNSSEFRRKTKTTTLALPINLMKWSIISVVIATLLLYVGSLRYYCMQDSPDLPSVSGYHENLSVVLYELIDKSMLPWPTKLQHWSSISSVAPVVIKIPNFSKRKNSVSYSKPFFAFQNGYKLCLKYYPYGITQEGIEGHYMSVYVHLVKGPHDEMLEKNGHFPIHMNRNFIIELLNPREDADHVQKLLPVYNCNTEWTRRTTDVNINPYGCGFPEFISLGWYNFEPEYSCDRRFRSNDICHYLANDDAIYFRVRHF